MKIKVQIEAEIEVEFDETSEDFKSMFKQYNEYFHECDYEEFAESVAYSIACNGGGEFIEGVGYPLLNGKKQKDYRREGAPELDNCVNVIGDLNINDTLTFDCRAYNIDEEE